ncbi:tRNA (5-methylaminomethyl-2-thiouridine)(34)-methyltransferase MnmD [Flavobacterium sp. NST-5]|uniref:tRNA (5-methylaminomethyl-2-thiouridine)(34)-methyltransferase MnmD n=1 Tax=Flavobacterium ichthyis TaxID=2698827 RepID=A0ABW9Z5T9_9FLAO|nr:tRNA (5-methylaminomethyl-2-thiouridine)(34)-methyltransferase MnmD [Flavobacterium ichthyis]NBL64203.1 tRNA (5-methylaminomethyl-2-thiouridine)(34)-methyltransferase MnmD [Flavobacterium ichthyis]
MKREIIQTADGSQTIYMPDLDETYHSRHGAIQEAKHVFIKNGLSILQGKPISILEIGFGTGLNAFITFLETIKSAQKINYVGIEAFPITPEDAMQMKYSHALNAGEFAEIFLEMHTCLWNEKINLGNHFSFEKKKIKFQEIDFQSQFDLIYFDAFGYNVQPELWNEAIFEQMFLALKNNGILVTYACRTPIITAMKSSGFMVEKLAGPPGKREMLRAYKR